MTTSELTTGFNKETFEAFLATRDEPDWVTQKRREAFAEFEQQSAFDLDPEEYKRVDLRIFRADQYRLADQNQKPAEFATLLQDRAEFGGAISHVDGQTVHSAFDETIAEKGVLFGDLNTLLKSHGDTLKPHFLTKAVQAETDRFSAWHAAFWTGGTVLYVPRNVEVQVPLYSLIGLSQSGIADLSHTLVVLEDGASATLLEETASAEEETKGLHIGAVELLVGQGANLRYVQLQNWNSKVFHFAHQSGRIARDASLQWTVGGLGSRLSHIHQDIHLDGPGADAQVNGVTFALDRQVISYYTQQTHHEPNTHSDLLYKEVVRDKARAIWRGMIKVDPDAQLTDGYQRNDALVLSADARIDAIPGLEIEADDVRCTHGATAGQVDEEQVLYCMSRGMTRTESMHMIVEGFFNQVFDRIPVEIVRDTLSQAVEEKLGIG